MSPRYTVSAELLEEAQRSYDWHEKKGMRVAKPPAMPNIVAAWIVRHCVAFPLSPERTAAEPELAPTLPEPSALAEGWGHPTLSRKTHFFLAGKDSSLCNKWSFTGYRAPLVAVPQDAGTHDCTTCVKLLKGLYARGKLSLKPEESS